ncbi:MAG: TonB-dependent receptor [Myxococcales bacterium]|nr:TonB-dependent receptor [Myxococcales bacterium]
MKRGAILSVALASLASLASLAPAPAFAHELEPPVVVSRAAGEWPHAPDHHDVVVPVILVVSAEGKVISAEVEAPVSPEIDRAALAAAARSVWKPATRDGKPVAAKVRDVVRFQGLARAVPVGPAVSPVPPPATPPAVALAGAPPSVPAAVRVEGRAGARSASEVVRGRDVLGAAPHRTASDLLNVVPGVFVTQHSGEGKAHQIFMRGFDAVHGQDVELWVGGIPVNEVSNIHGQGYADLHFVPPEVVKEVVAQGGTYDPRQGDFAVAGSMRMKLGYAEPGVHARGTIGSFGSRRLLLVYRPQEASDETFASFEEYTTDGFGPNRAARRGSLVAQATHDFDAGFSLRALFTTYAGRFDSAGVVPQREVEAGRLDRYATLDAKQGGRSTRTHLLVDLHRDEGAGRFQIAPFVAFRGLSLRQNFTGYLTDSLRGGRDTLDSDNTEQLQDSVMLGGTGSYRRTVAILSSDDALEAGVYGRHDRIEQSQRRLAEVDDRVTETPVDARVAATNVAGYVDAQLRPTPKLVVRGGLRVDALAYSVEDRAGTPGPTRASQSSNLGKKVTFDYAAARGLHVLASYGDGFRSPQARGLANGQNAPFAKVTSLELGARWTHGRALSASAAAYTTELSDDLVFDPVTARNEAVPGTRRVGGTVELLARAGQVLVLAGSATYTRAAFVASSVDYAAGDLLPYVPQLVVRSDVRLEHRLATWRARDLVGRVGVGLDGVIRRPLPYGEIGQNVVLTDATAGLRFREVELSIDATNLLGQAYYDGQFVFASNFARSASPSRIAERHVTAGPPRAIYASLTLHL